MNYELKLLAEVVRSSVVLDSDTVAMTFGQLERLAVAVVALCTQSDALHKELLTAQSDARLGAMVRQLPELTALHHWPSGMWSHSLSGWYVTPEEALCETERQRARHEALLAILRQPAAMGKVGEGEKNANDDHRAP